MLMGRDSKSNKLKCVLIIIGTVVGIIFGPAIALPVKPPGRAEQIVAATKQNCLAFAESCGHLKQAISQLKTGDKQSIGNAKKTLLDCRKRYKAVEFFLEFYFKESAADFNAPPKYESEEPEDDYRAPHGLQQIETLLFADDAIAQKNELLELAADMDKAAQRLPQLFGSFGTSEAQLMLSLQLELVRIMTLGITGFDAPMLKSGIGESYQALTAIKRALQPFLSHKPSPGLSTQLSATLAYLKAHPRFDTFNRMRFLTAYAMPLQQQLVQYIKLLKLEIKTTGIFNAKAKNIFSADALNADVFLDFPAYKKQQVTLGRQLFFYKRLSGPATRSCATCHQPDRYFTDGLAKSINIDGSAQVLRNAPTLLYAGYQHTQFLDARATGLVEQVRDVLNNPHEMAATDSLILARLKTDKKYIALFKSAFPAGDYQQISMYGIAEALTAYILTLNPRNSAFDNYMAGNRAAMTPNQVKGFNLFMGKAQCGTCHFAPLFNGLIPPIYRRTELEIIGTPKTDNDKLVQADDDEGVYRQMPLPFTRGAFKTPTVRNVAKTGPYMHNGSFHTLDKVIDFYNAGGGNGWGLNNAQQTLSADSLLLSSKEIKDIVSFLNSLTDKPVKIK